MPEKTKDTKDTKSGTRRTQVKDLPKAEKELTPQESKKVKGGLLGQDFHKPIS